MDDTPAVQVLESREYLSGHFPDFSFGVELPLDFSAFEDLFEGVVT